MVDLSGECKKYIVNSGVDTENFKSDISKQPENKVKDKYGKVRVWKMCLCKWCEKRSKL